MAVLRLVPQGGEARTRLAQQLSCWARTDSGFTDPRIDYLTCCMSGYYAVPADLCAEYGELPFTSLGEPIPCDPDTDVRRPFDILPSDVPPINVDTCTTEGAVLSAPTGLAVTDITDTSATVSWDPVAGAEAYDVQYRAVGGIAWTDAPSVTDPTTPLSGLEPGTSYQVRVRATGETAGYTPSPWSVIAFETTGDTPTPVDPPTGVGTGNQGPASIEVSWDPVDGAQTYVIYYKPTAESVWMVAEQISPPTTAGTVTSLTSDTSYDFAVTVMVDGEFSDKSTAVTDSTTAGAAALDQVVLTAGTPTATSVPLTWVDIPDAASYQIRFRKTDEVDWYPVFGTEPSGATGTSMEGLDSDTEYVFSARAIGDGTTNTSGPWSADVTVSTASAEAFSARSAPRKRAARKRSS